MDVRLWYCAIPNDRDDWCSQLLCDAIVIFEGVAATHAAAIDEAAEILFELRAMALH